MKKAVRNNKELPVELLETLVSKYNNALQCIVLTADLAMIDLEKTSPVFDSFKQIKQAAMAAATRVNKPQRSPSPDGKKGHGGGRAGI